MAGSIQRGKVTSTAKRAAVQRVVSRHAKTVQITEGLRRAIVGSSAFRAGRTAS